MSFNVEPLWLPVSTDPSDQLGDIRLRLYQAELRRCNNRIVLLEAPTSSGKTLAYLVRAVENRRSEPRFGTTVIIYPTNALIWDQARSLYELITAKLGKTANLTVESSLDSGWRTTDGNADVDIYVLNGETLASLSQESRSSEGKALIEELHKNQARTRIILSNPEILYYLFLYRFARSEDLLEQIFSRNPPNLLILDEFHLYHGYTLATITYMLAYIKTLFNQVIFSSATPIEVGNIVHEHYQRVTAEPSSEGDIVRHPMELGLRGNSGILGSEDVPFLSELVNNHLERTFGSTSVVKVLVILNSVITCIRLIEALEKEHPGQVTAIHGFVPARSRPKNQSEYRSLVVGTSAIEVGVDFDTASLIFEAQDSSSFIQRIGRGARHGRCYSTAVVESLYLGKLRENLANSTELNPYKLSSVIRRSLPTLPSYLDFPHSPQAAPILAAILLNWTIQRPAGGRHLNNSAIVAETNKQLGEGKFHIPKELGFSTDELLGLCKESTKYGILQLARKMSCRSSMDSLPSVFRTGSDTLFDSLSVEDLAKVEFKTITKEALTSQGIKIPWRMRMEEEFINVVGLKHRLERIIISPYQSERYENSPSPLTMFRVDCDNEDLESKIHNILRNQPAFALHSKADWRLCGFYTSGRDFLVIGGDAYLAWFLKQKSFAQ